MPSGNLHDIINKVLLGEDYRIVSAIMDATAPFHGPQHRKDLIHNPVIAGILAGGLDDPKKFAAAALHYGLDKSMTVKQGRKVEAAFKAIREANGVIETGRGIAKSHVRQSGRKYHRNWK